MFRLIADSNTLMDRRAGPNDPSFVELWVIVPVSVLVAMIPISINGLGLREGALVGLLALCEVPVDQGAIFALLALAVSLVFAVAGGLLLLQPYVRGGQRAK